jgi:autotransporter-associated beta strand protein
MAEFSDRGFWRRRLAARLISAVTVALATATAAHAACTPSAAAAPPGTTVTCSGTTTAIALVDPGYGSATLTGITINVLTAASVNGGASGILVGDAVINNSGRLTAQGSLFSSGVGIEATDHVTVTNNAGATIDVPGVGIVAVTGTVNLINSGSIRINPGSVSSQNNSGVAAGTSATVTNNAGADITGGYYGIKAGTFVNLVNSGNVSAFSAGVFLGLNGMGTAVNAQTDATVVNNAGAKISAGIYAIKAGGFVNLVNSGSIIAEATGPVFGGSPTAGTAISAQTSATVTNNAGGSIFGHDIGIAAAGGGSTIFNAGTITGGISAIQFGGTGNTLTLGPGSVISGNVIGTGGDTFQLGGTGSAAFDVSAIGAAAQYRGFATFNKIGASTWTLTGTGAASQNWTISGGTLIGDSNSLKGATLTNNAALVFAQDFSGAYAGVIGGSGTLAKSGTGTLTLTGANTYTGATNVNAGTLSVNGSIASSSLTTVNAGATLGGNGVVGNTTINGGTLAPGNSIGLLTVQGNLVFTAAASYMVEISPANADRTNVTGAATLGGATVNASFAAGTYVNKQYTVLNAGGGVVGAFNSLVNTDLPANFHSSLSYDANNVYLNLALNFVPPPNMGLNVNQQNVANAIVGFFNANGTIPLAFGGLTAAGLTQVSGELATGSQQTTFDAMGLFMGLITDPFIGGRGDPVTGGAGTTPFAAEDEALAYANGKPRSKSERDAYAAVYRKAPVMADPFTQRWSVWAAGYGGSQTTDGNTVLGSNNTRSSIGGVAVGADYRFSPYTLAGFAIAGGGTNFSVNGLGSGRSDLFQAGAFVRHNVGPAYISAALAYGWQDITTDRTVTIVGTDLLHANFNANAYSGRVEGGYRFVTPWMTVGLTPYAAGQFTTFDLPAYAEQAIAGANTFALTYASKSATDTRSELGIRTDKSFAMQNGIFTLRGRAAWAHDFNPDRNIAATFQTLPGASFVVNGAAQASDAALVTGSAEMKWLNGFALAATFEGEFSGVTRSYAGKGVARYTW